MSGARARVTVASAPQAARAARSASQRSGLSSWMRRASPSHTPQAMNVSSLAVSFMRRASALHAACPCTAVLPCRVVSPMRAVGAAQRACLQRARAASRCLQARTGLRRITLPCPRRPPQVHYLGDPGRGSVWEEVIISCPPAVRLLAMSATIANAKDLGGWIDQARPCQHTLLPGAASAICREKLHLTVLAAFQSLLACAPAPVRRRERRGAGPGRGGGAPARARPAADRR